MTKSRGLSGDGGVVSHGSIAWRPNRPRTFLIGTVGGVASCPSPMFFVLSLGDWAAMGGNTGIGDGTADNNAFDWEDEMGDEAINLPARRKTKQNYKTFYCIKKV